MKKLLNIAALLAMILLSACPTVTPPDVDFENAEDMTIYDYISENRERFTSFISILEKGSLVQTLSAYNPYGTGYTLFLPDNEAVDRFIANDPRFATLDDLLADQAYVNALARFHVVNREFLSNEFPFGAFPEPTLSKDYLTVSFIIEEDSSYYKINNTAAVTRTNIETSNGYVHEIREMLAPIILTSNGWLKDHPGFEIFSQALELTGLESMIDIDYKETSVVPVTVLVEPDSVFEKAGISSIEDLIALISPADAEYTLQSNPLYNFVSYHILSGNFFLDDFVDVSKVYNTFSEVPLNINGVGLDVQINKGKQVFDTIINNADTTIIDYILFYYDQSNITTKSGAIHFIDHIMRVKKASRTNVSFQFEDEPLIIEYRQTDGAYEFEASDSLRKITWSGAKLYYSNLTSSETNAWWADYIEIEGDFVISYTTPKIIQGTYDVRVRAEAINSDNAVIEVFIDNKKVGGIIDLTTGGSASSPFKNFNVGTFTFAKYSEHVIEVRPLIPGRFLWDAIIFDIPKQ